MWGHLNFPSFEGRGEGVSEKDGFFLTLPLFIKTSLIPLKSLSYIITLKILYNVKGGAGDSVARVAPARRIVMSLCKDIKDKLLMLRDIELTQLKLGYLFGFEDLIKLTDLQNIIFETSYYLLKY